jgi:hypothetical protein
MADGIEKIYDAILYGDWAAHFIRAKVCEESFARSILVGGAKTGRFSCRGTNLANVPRGDVATFTDRVQRGRRR